MSRVKPLVLRAGDEQVLREWGRSWTISAGLAQRARFVLLAAQGESNAQVARLVGVSLPTVSSWRIRYTSGGWRRWMTGPGRADLSCMTSR